MADAKTGLDCKLYYNAATYVSPSWQEVTIARDVTLSRTKGEADVSNRGSRFKKRKATLIDASITTEFVWDPDNPDFAAFQQAFDNDEPIEVLALDGGVDVPGSQGLRAFMDVFKFDRTEPLEGAVMAAIDLKPTYDTDHEPAWYTVPGT